MPQGMSMLISHVEESWQIIEFYSNNIRVMCLYWSKVFGELVGSAYYYVALVGKCAGKVYRELVESAYYYVAPEVLKRNYGKEIDALVNYNIIIMFQFTQIGQVFLLISTEASDTHPYRVLVPYSWYFILFHDLVLNEIFNFLKYQYIMCFNIFVIVS
ncbi:uncharacterized protein LOC127115907 isoform X1 [Lathyrus oleraceus]|uniref:uncharacterized protein LOC127115907 isoform X1 n=1 Tax=Pisum sativum TaxID=3888 RepID=UPI0021D23073|nr:uncharacterized protein LOC127115907 isoform X1 [Pisum sativum]